jgi:L-asparaginase II
MTVSCTKAYRPEVGECFKKTGNGINCVTIVGKYGVLTHNCTDGTTRIYSFEDIADLELVDCFDVCK